MRAHFSQVKVAALCASLLAMLAPTLVGCGRYVCSVDAAVLPSSALTVAGGVVYGKSGGVFALRASDGAVLWQAAGDRDHAPVAPPLTPPVVHDQTVVVSWGVGAVEAWRATDGKPLWRSQPISGIPAPSPHTPEPLPVVADGAVYASADYGTIATWDEHDGHTLWVSRFDPDADAEQQNAGGFAALPQPVVVGSAIYVSAGRTVYALRASDGAVRWRLPPAPAGVLYTMPVVSANTVYVEASDGTVYALDAENGALRWRTLENPRVVALPTRSVVVAGQAVYASHAVDTVRALSETSGAELWRFVTGETPSYPVQLSPPTVEGGRVYVSSAGNGLYALEVATGKLVWRSSVNPTIALTSAPTLHAPIAVPDLGLVVVIGGQGVEAWRSSDGRAAWTLSDPNLQYVAIAAGTVYLSQWAVTACAGSNALPPVLALRGTDGTQAWHSLV